MFGGDGTFRHPANETPVTPGGGPWIPEFFGDASTVNGKAWPRLDVDRGTYRFRVHNGSQARFHDVRLRASSGAVLPFFQSGSHGGLLDAPVRVTTMLLAPGQGVDVVVDVAALAAGTEVVLVNTADATAGRSGPGRRR